jgi:hypothetical protein
MFLPLNIVELLQNQLELVGSTSGYLEGFKLRHVFTVLQFRVLSVLQNQLELVGSASGQPGGQALAAAWHAALEASAAQHFPGNPLINCMCHNTNVSEQ